MTNTREDATRIDVTTRGASRFYWGWLIFSTTVSVLGNIAHALLVAPDPLRLLAAVASVVPPAFVLGSTHSVALSLKMRRFALIYVLGLLMTIGVAACAFLLSFDALRALAVMLGWPSARAWLFPIAIDVSIAQATFGLLSLGPARGSSAAQHTTAAEPQPARNAATPPAAHAARIPPLPPAATTRQNGAEIDTGRAARPLSTPDRAIALPEAPTTVTTADSKRVLTAVGHSPAAPIDLPELVRWKPTAHELVRNGTTSKDPETVAAILAEHAAGTPPTTISRRRGVHHSTVGRILAGAEALTG
jgi:hypothetical protein